jgi:hypothetical protein
MYTIGHHKNMKDVDLLLSSQMAYQHMQTTRQVSALVPL